MSAISRIAIAMFLGATVLAACSHPYNSASTATTATGASAPDVPQWGRQYVGKDVTSLGTDEHRCIGYLSVENRYTGSVPGATVLGWGWDSVLKKPLQYVLLTNADRQVIGAADGTAIERDDVPKRIPAITSKMTGWRGVAHVDGGKIEAWELIPNSSVCLLGAAELQ